jgi:hypothetical protein
MLEGEVRAVATDDVRGRVTSALQTKQPPARSSELNELMTDGCARVLTLETERLHLGRRISELAADAEDPGAAIELRRLWARRRVLAREVSELRSLLGQLGAVHRSDRISA